MTDDIRQFGVRLGAFRRSAGLSQQELAERSGLSVRAISNLERGRTRWPHPDSVHRLADALGLRDQARVGFIAVAGRRLVPTGTSAAEASDERPARPGHGPAVPQQLPCSVRQFAGRQSELAALSGLLDRAGAAAPHAVVISAIGGTPGVGKTALALHWGRQVAGRFPDGQLYVNLRGFGPSGKPMLSAEAIRCLLSGLGFPAERIPAAPDAQAGLYRSLLSGKRMLVVLDNARDAEQVRPLLPGGSGCLVVVTSRSQLLGLVAGDGAYSLTLDVLTEAEARELLALRLGAGRLGAEPEAVGELIELCARLPLALAIVAARAVACPALRLGALAESLKDVERKLDALETGDAATSVRAVFSWSVDSLPTQPARLFRLLGLHPGPDVTIPAAASLAAISLPQARRALTELAAAHLVTEHVPGRFSLHDLLRAYAAEQASAAGAVQPAALTRILDHYLHTAHSGALLLNPLREPVTLAPASPGVTPEHLASHRHALAWFDAEHQVLIAAAALAARSGFDACAWQLPWALADYLLRKGSWHDCAAIQRTALAAATRQADLVGQATARRHIAWACARLGDYDEATAQLTTCLELHQQLGDRAGEARTQQSLSSVAEFQGRDTDALRYAERALALFRATGDRAGQAGALNDVGWSHARLGAYERARACCQQALALHQEVGHRAGEAVTWDSLAYVEHHLGRLPEAAACYQRAIGLFRELGARVFEANAVADLGDTYHAAADEDKAQDAWRQAAAIFDDLHSPDAARIRAKLRQRASDSNQEQASPP